MKSKTMQSRLAALSALLIVNLGVAVVAAAGGSSITLPAGGDAAGKAAAHARAHMETLEGDAEDCAVEASTCLADVECLECMTSYVDHPVEYTECLAEYDWSSATTCDEEAARPCCANLMSRGNCLESGSFLEYWGCNLREFHGCEDYEMTCVGVTSEVDDSSGESSSSSSNSSDLTSSLFTDEVTEGEEEAQEEGGEEEEGEEEEVVASEESETAAAAGPLARVSVVTGGVLAGVIASTAGADLLLLLQSQ